MNLINTRELSVLTQEYTALSNKSDWTKRDERRAAYLQSAIKAVGLGASLEELDEQELNAAELRMGVTPTKLTGGLTREQRTFARGFQAFLHGDKETRDAEGVPLTSHIGTYNGLGYFVPNGFFGDVKMAMKWYDVLFDPDSVTLLEHTKGRPFPIPVLDDTQISADLVGEGNSQTSTDIGGTINHAVLSAYSFNSKRWVVSRESFQDQEGALSTYNLFKRISADRMSRGIGKYLVQGTGTNQPLGLLSALAGAGAPIVIAAGSSGNDGGSNTGTNSLGSADFANAWDTLDTAYLASKKCAWIMNKKTYGFLLTVVTKYGQPLINFSNGGLGQILGVPVKVCPSMPNIGASAQPVVLGDFSYFATRIVCNDKDCGIRVVTEAPGLVEQGNIGLMTFVRADCALLWSGTTSNLASCPFVVIQNHS